MTTDLQRRLAEETEASEAGRELDAVYHRNTQPAKDPSQVYSLRLPVDRIEEIRALAAQNATQPTALIRRWVLERLDDELAGREQGDARRHARARALAEDEEVLVVKRSEMVGEIQKALVQVLLEIRDTKA